MDRYALNSAVPTAPSRYDCRLLTVEEAAIGGGPAPSRSRIGYRETGAALARVLDIEEPAVDRRTIRMEPRDDPDRAPPRALAGRPSRRGAARVWTGCSRLRDRAPRPHRVNGALHLRRGLRTPRFATTRSGREILADVQAEPGATPLGRSGARTAGARRRRSRRPL